MIGSGFLALPYSFAKCGWLLGTLFMLFISFLCFIFGRQILEVMSRVECLKQAEEIGIYIPKLTIKQLFLGGYPKQEIPEDIQPEITDRRFDVSCIVGMLYGEGYGHAYMIFLYLFLTGAQTAYVSIFSSSFASTIPLGFADTCDIYNDDEFFGSCRGNYWFFLVIYCFFMMYITIKGLKEQKWLQSVLTILRFVIILLIISTSLALIADSANIRDDSYTPFKMPTLVNISNLLGSLSTMIFSFIYQPQFPSIAEFVKDKRKNLPIIIVLVGIATSSVYLLIAFIVPIAIRDVKPQCSIEYSDYSAGYSQSEKPWWTYIISYLVVLFPAMDVFSTFPLMAISVSDNLLTLKYGIGAVNSVRDIYVKLIRVISVIVPFFISFFIFNLGQITELVGLFGFFLVPIGIPLMHIASREMIQVQSKYNAYFYNKVIFI